MTGAAFNTAVEESKKLKAKPSNDELLQLYALYKQAINNPSFEKSEAPGMFDLKGKAKRSAWQKLVTDGVTQQEAESKYVELVNSLKEKYGYDPNKVPEAVGSS